MVLRPNKGFRAAFREKLKFDNPSPNAGVTFTKSTAAIKNKALREIEAQGNCGSC
jgi:hypothetical protein